MSTWRKSSRSMSNGHCVEVTSWRKPSLSFSNGNCVEVSGHWAKSSRSLGTECVEAANCACGHRGVLVRDSKDPDGPVLSFGGETWRRFTAALSGR